MIHHLFFFVTTLALDLALSFGPLVLGLYAFGKLNECFWENGQVKFSLKPFLLMLVGIALLVAILPEARGEWDRMHKLEAENPDPGDRF
jgi:hypothetical protein